MKKTALPAADLFVMIEREYRRRQPPGCDECAQSLPFPLPVAPGKKEWLVVPGHECHPACASVLEEVVSELQRRFSLAHRDDA